MRRTAMVWAAALALLALPAMAGTFVALDDAALVGGSETIIQGQVIGQQSFWSEDGRIIFTDTTVRVDEAIVGQAPDIVTVRTAGGQVGSIIIEAPGFPKFQADEHVLLFLGREASDDSLRVHGYQQGQFRVVTRLDGVTLAVPMVDEEVRFLSPKGGLAPETRSVEINEFKARIRSLASRVRVEMK